MIGSNNAELPEPCDRRGGWNRPVRRSLFVAWLFAYFLLAGWNAAGGGVAAQDVSPEAAENSTPVAVNEGERGADDDSVRKGREALGDMAFAPWYDADKDELKRVNVRPPRQWVWLERVADLFRGIGSLDWDGSWLGTFFNGLSTVVQLLIYAVLFAVLFGLAYLFVRVFSRFRDRRRRGGDEDAFEEEQLRQARVDALPMQLSAPRGDFLAEARRRYEAGDYSGAIIFLFSHELLQLDRHQRIQLERGKTNRQYLREVRNEPFLASALYRTMIAFEDVFFGHHDLDRPRFEACWNEVDEFHRRLPTGATP